MPYRWGPLSPKSVPQLSEGLASIHSLIFSILGRQKPENSTSCVMRCSSSVQHPLPNFSFKRRDGRPDGSMVLVGMYGVSLGSSLPSSPCSRCRSFAGLHDGRRSLGQVDYSDIRLAIKNVGTSRESDDSVTKFRVNEVRIRRRRHHREPQWVDLLKSPRRMNLHAAVTHCTVDA
jgi:hypothetical protein